MLDANEKINEIEGEMDDINNLEEEPETDKKTIHEEKIKLQDALKDNIELSNNAERYALNAILPLSKSNEKKKKLEKAKTDLNTLKNSKSALSTKWRKFGELQKR